MPRLIDADGLWWYKLYDIDETGTSVAVKAVLLKDVDNAPTIDAVPVVRCGECIHRQESVFSGEGNIYCREKRCYSPENGYCNYGERRCD